MSLGYRPVVAFYGDSITVGMAPFLVDPVGKLGAARLQVDAKTGSSAKDWRDNGWVRQSVVRNVPRLVVIALGTNPQERDALEYAGIMVGLGDDAQAAGAVDVFYVSPFAVDDDGKRAAALQRAVRPERFINGYEIARTLPRVGEGNVHFPPAGYKALAERLAGKLGPAVMRIRRPGGDVLGAALTLAGGAASLVWDRVPLLPFLPRR